ncbi:P-loop containing nucleoside triphosphate hydrolase protein [Clavulina sp. PMI_390]|nr:P-loop containing nucleoside triphosphate hydrolase protein [Clavulina sp. PMI_390]
MASSPGLDPVYNLSNLSRTNGIDAAVARFDRVGNSDKGFALELRKLLRVPNVLALVVSSGYDRLRLTLERELLDKIPEDDGAYLSSDPQNYLSSISKEFITTIATYFSALAPPTSVSATKYTQHNFNTPRVVVVLEAVVLIAKNDTPSTGFSWDASRRACDELGIAYPQTESEAETLCQDLLVGEEWGLRRATEFYLETLANPEMAQRIKETTLLVVDRPDPSEFPPRPPVPPTTAAPTNAVPTPMEAAEEEEPIAQIPVKPEAVQPYFNSAPEDFGAWQIFISQSCVSDLKKFHRSDRKSFNIIEKKIVELSTGFFSDSNHKRLVGGGNDDVAILEAKMTGDLRLVYRIDLYTDSAMQDDKQCIMIHGVFTHAQFDHRLWDRVSRSIGQSGQDYRNKCNYRVTPRDRGRGYNVTDPMSWPHDDKMMEIKSTARPEFSDDEFLQLHKILALEKFIPMSTNVFRSIMAEEDDNLAYRFKVSPTETQVIAFPSSCFVIGRSGTGKTTTMLFKLLSIETAHRQKGSKIRQIFLTQSHILAQRVQEYYAQLFGTEQHGYTKIEKSKLDSTGLVNLDEESDARGDLPAKYSELTDAHFPLFVTFNQIRRMLEKDLEIDYSDRYSGTSKRAATAGKMDFTEVGQKANMTLSDLIEGEAGVSARDKNRVAMKASLEKAAQQPFVTFQVFNHQYWKHFDQSLTANLDPAVVYSEIMGIICGHEDTLGTEGGYLSREAYLNLSSRRYASFANERSRLYSIFEKYRALKLKKGAYDSPQRSHSILDGLSRSMQKVDYLYVDECQDFLIVDIKLLKQLCSNPKGLFWGGDTAQTISLGSSFRFQDLKTVLYNEEQNEPLVKAGKRAAVESKTFQLLVNYRSHGGIVDAASSIISLISQMFPESIDELSPETAVVTGPKPCVFRGWDNGVVHFEQFLFGGEGAKGDFGARQVILVRNDAVREELRKELGEAGLILTLLESKGLEFDDVLMYGFFEDGAAQDSQWRVVLNAIEGEKNVPTLDGRKHAIVNTELKNLYVGITRARHHCWIWDSSVAAEPMVRYWQSKNLIKILGPGDPIPPLASESKPEEWHSTGRDLFRKGLYAQAASCFAKALRPDEQKIALAYQKRSDAQAIDGGPKKRAAFKLAGAAFMECADFVAVDSEKRILYKRAVDAFNEAEESELALIALSKSVDETEAAKLLADKGQLDQALELVRPKKGPSRVDAQVAKNIIQKAQLVFLQSERYSEASNLFAGLEAQLDFIRQHGLRQAHKAVLKIYGLPDVAADLYKIDGEFREAADALRTSGRSDSVDLAVRAILDGLWVQGFGHDLGQAAKLLVEDIRALKTNGLPLKTRDEVSGFSNSPVPVPQLTILRRSLCLLL